jgi:type IV pilus assembly protein PilQ
MPDTILLAQQAQQNDRFVLIENKLKDLAQNQVKGLNENVDFSISGASIQEFLRGIAEAHSINISVDPALDYKIYNNFANESVINVILFILKEYDLDIRFSGSILSFVKYVPVEQGKPTYVAKDIVVKFNAYSNMLSLDLKNDTLAAVAKKITQVTGKNVIFSSGLGSTIVSIYIENMPFDAALNKFSYANNLKIVKTDDNFYVIKALPTGDEDLVDVNAKTNPFLKSGNSIPNSTVANSTE